MPTTPNGTVWTIPTTYLPDGKRAALSKTATPGDFLVVYAHGSSGTYNQFATLTAWAGIRNWLMDNHVPVVEALGGDDWGGDASRITYQQAVAWARTQVPGVKIIVMGRSMGGLVAYWLATQSEFSADVQGLIVNSGTSDLAYRYSVATGSVLTAMNTAYGLPGSTKDVTAFTAASAGHDPMLFSGSLFSAVPVLQLWGTDDTQVPPAQHGQAWWTAFSSYLPIPPSAVDVRSGGDHSSTNGSYLQIEAMSAFLAAVIGESVSPVEPEGDWFRILAAYLYVGGNRYEVTPA